MAKIFIDGSAGTTGLRIHERLANRKDITLISLPENLRKDLSARADAINSADLVFLCLPDDAAKESVSLLKNPSVKIIDTSTAHRVNPGWTYGFAELKGQREKIKNAHLVANPGCHASGFISLVKPLVDAGAIKNSANLTCFSITGYSGGGKKMIAEYEGEMPKYYDAPRQYGLTQNHKHLPEMVKVCNLEKAPIFCPIVAPFKCGMQVSVPLFLSDLNCSLNDVKEIYKKAYTGKIVRYADSSENGFISSSILSGYDDMEISVYGNDERITVVSNFDNLGKGASGSAIQNMNILLGLPEETGLNIKGE